MPRIHVTGAAGSGVTTLGKALANTLDLPHVDTDDVFWMPTDPPFGVKRPAGERIDLLSDWLKSRPAWVWSGCARPWAEALEPLQDLVVFLTLDPALRMARLRRRESRRFGPRIAPGGDMAGPSAAFLAWAAAYDTAGDEQRSRAAHEAWLSTRPVPVLRLSSAEPVARLVAEVRSVLQARRPPSAAPAAD
ncbi:adenylate kinase [Aureimonas pseudogalii]|uniref:Adenylate kinase family enzyme n=1 Tax=Aureimonas pseudogalii TaxID=1744844 RepID=A0A7W6H6S4_9HYPH|nr:adenylate kinase [Aureimonas pseudogalii]MBB3999619.1 adenylate kinase family enzyme [Aureimonas pseudogalii]